MNKLPFKNWINCTKLTCVVLFCLISNTLSGQKLTGKGNNESACNPKMIFVVTEQLADYQGGQKALVKLLNEKIELSAKYKKGDIFLKFLVNCKGEAADFTLLRGTHKEVGQLIVDVLKENQGFTAAMQRDKAVDSFKMLQVSYRRGKFVQSKK